jgi:holliday junction DNA helicase RuvB
MQYRLDFYSIDALMQIITRASRIMSISIDKDGIRELARCSRGMPNVTLQLLRRISDYAQIRAERAITKQIVDEVLNLEGIDSLGLEEIHRRILRIIIEKFNGGPVGVITIAELIGLAVNTIEDIYLPYLIMLGFINRTPEGLIVTHHAYEI